MKPRLSAFFQNIGQGFPVINRRLRICHQHNGCKTSFHCRCRTAHNIFLIGKARIPEMYMNVYKPRRNDLTGRINPLNLPFCCFCTVLLLLRIAPLLRQSGLPKQFRERDSLLCHRRNLIFLNQNVPITLELRFRVYYISICNINHPISFSFSHRFL